MLDEPTFLDKEGAADAAGVDFADNKKLCELRSKIYYIKIIYLRLSQCYVVNQ